MKHPIDQFTGGYDFLSNFYTCDVEFEGKIYKSTEHAFQAAKSTDPTAREFVASKDSPAQAKRSGRRIKMRDDWEYIKDAIMEEIVRDKFTRHEDLKRLLLGTGDSPLIEGNTWNDRIWGVDLKTGKGENRLGKILMKVRKELGGSAPTQFTDQRDKPTERLKVIKPNQSILDGLSS